MGKYFQGLFFSVLQASTPTTRFTLIYTKHLPQTNINFFKKKLITKNLGRSVNFQQLDLKVHNFQKNNYDEAYKKNQEVISQFLTGRRDGESKQLWLIPCLMQEPTVPVIPRNPGVISLVIWYDLMPYLFNDHYFNNASLAYIHSYLKRINLLMHVDQIFAISLKSKSDLVEYISIPERRITVIDGSINESLLLDPAQWPEDLPNAPFYLCPASPEPNKNVLNTIIGFGIFNQKNKNKYQLLVTSKYDPSLAKEAHKYASKVIFLGHISDAELKWLYEECEGLLFASTYEGLGLPILEAVNFNKKVVCSDIAAFIEISGGKAFYWCNPQNPQSIADALELSEKTGPALPKEDIPIYDAIKLRYTWENAADTFLRTASQVRKHQPSSSSTIAIVGPHPASFSAIGKFVAETLPYLLEQADVHYYFDSGPSDLRFGLTIFHYLKEYEHLYPIEKLAQSTIKYDKIIYHMGSSDHHMKTYLLSKKMPATIVLHDTNLGGKGLAGQMLSNGFISPERYKTEIAIETQFLDKPERFITTLVSSQEKIITHSKYAADLTHDYSLGVPKIIQGNHPMSVLNEPKPLNKQGPIRIGLAGILSEVKGIDIIEWLFEETDRLRGCELYIFGFGYFIDKNRLFILGARYPNLNISLDIPNLQFQELLSSLDLIINYRLEYHGETSRTTLEAIRAQVVPIVRNIGWFSELPDNTCIKLDSIDELPLLINNMGQNIEKTRSQLAPIVKAGHKLLKESFQFDDYIELLLKDK
jgi:glycosyltransferase involved in cell wall biosynthesis